MDNLEDLIRFENENTSLDFKVNQYSKEQHEALIKDIISMANADVEGDRHIIIGVDYKKSNDRDINGIKRDEFIDSATYQQLVRENIEPEIKIDYFLYELDDKCLGIFEIKQCSEKPYMMKKDFGKIKKGDCFIRKGSSQFRMIREDFERIIDKRISCTKFNGKVKIYFTNHARDQEITLPAANDIQLPSERAANEIRNIIKRKKSSPNSWIDSITAIPIPGYHDVPYENRSIEELEKTLKNIEETYRDQDYYEFFELRSHKLNITIANEGDAYIEDAMFQMDVEKIDGLIILKEIYKKPKDSPDYTIRIASLDFGQYPEVEDNGTFIRIYNSSALGRLGKWDIRHQIPKEAFLEPVRFLFSKNLAGQVIQLKCKLYGKNLQEPIEEILKIKIV